MTRPASTPFGAPQSCASCGAPFTPMVVEQTLCDRCHGLSHPEPANPLQDTHVAGYRLLHEIGAGRFSHSWVAEDEGRRPYILKLLRRYATDPNVVQRFLAEAQRLCDASELSHPNLARPVNAGVHLVSAFFLVYESGGEHTLADELRERGRLATARALEIGAQIADGLAPLHGTGVVHLDLKPANIALSRAPDGGEQAVVLDAITSHLLAEVGLRDGVLPLASAAYVSPEEARGQPVDERSDFYAVGVLLFQLLTGRLPFSGASADDLLRAHRERPPLRLRDAGRKVHADVETLVARLLAKDPAHRPHSGDELGVLLRALVPIADAVPANDPPPPPAEDMLPVAVFPTARELTPPQMLPPAVDPALERAMMGEVPPQPPEKPFGIPSWVVRPPRLSKRMAVIAAASCALAVSAAAVVARRAHSRPAAPAAPPMAPSADVAAVATPPPPAPEPEPPLHKPGPSPHAHSFDLAQKAIWTQKPALAQSILGGVLRAPALTRRDRARASKLMGDAEVKRGRKGKALAWYQKAFRLYDDPEERAKVAKLLQR